MDCGGIGGHGQKCQNRGHSHQVNQCHKDDKDQKTITLVPFGRIKQVKQLPIKHRSIHRNSILG